jgi:hypothetical protein
LSTGDPEPELREQYRLAVEEYRFQVGLNWRRSEYFFVLNVGVLVAGATLLASDKAPRALVGLVFMLGALLASLSFLANDTQSGYYHAARDLKKRLEERLDLGGGALATTPGHGFADRSPWTSWDLSEDHARRDRHRGPGRGRHQLCRRGRERPAGG